MSMSHLPQANGTDHEMHMAHMDMDHGEQTPCERCEEHSGEEIAMTSSSVSVSDVALSSLQFVAFNSLYTIDYNRSAVPKSHLAAAGPPVVPDIVSTIVLRT